jgi:hypothetical protein
MTSRSAAGTTADASPARDMTTAGATAGFRQKSLAAAMFIAPWGFVLGNLVYAWETRHGGSDGTGAGALALTRAHPGLDRFAMVVTMAGALLMVPAAVGAMRLIHRRAARLGLTGGSLMAAGYIAYFGLVFADHIELVMAAQGTNQASYAKILDESLSGASVIWVYLTFLIGNLIGTFLLGLALRRSRTVPAWVSWGVMGWPILHVAGLFAGSEWFEVAGALVQAAGFAGVAICLLRQPLPAETDPAVARPGRTKIPSQPGTGSPAQHRDPLTR